MQAQIDLLNEKYIAQIKEAENDGTYFSEIGKDLSEISIEGEPANSFNGANVTEETEKNKYRYYDKTTLESLDLNDMEIEFLVNIQDREIIAIGGFEYEGNKYYTLEQIRESPKVGGLERGEITIGNITYEAKSNSEYTIKIEDIKCSKYVKKYTVKYKKDTDTTYITSGTNIIDEDYSFNVKTASKYYIQIIDAAGVTKEVSIAVGVPIDAPEVSTEPSFSRAYGVIEIEFLKGTTYMPTTTPNEPNMTDDMKAVYWENGVEKVEGESEDFDKSKWYEYIAQSGNTETGGTSKWANAKTSDGSYWVWIPRYAYRIVYFDTPTHADEYRVDSTQTTGIIGYSDARGLVNTEGKTPSDLQEPVTSVSIGTNLLRPHPVFETDYSQGGWESKIEGIWVAKYEMSMEKNGVTTIINNSTTGNVLTSDTVKAVSKPGVTSWRWITIGNMYTNGYNYDREKESHLMKNSEWGAVAYLTESKYGRNGTAVTKNTSSSYYTAGGNNAKPTSQPLQSTTGNEYGIFDTVGGSYEYVTGYIADSSQNYGNSFASVNNTTNNKKNSTQYATVYQMASSNDYEENYIMNANKVFGDATIEISDAGDGSTSWHSAVSCFQGILNGTNFPFLLRGGGFGITDAGTFNFYRNLGSFNSADSFRITLIVK